MNNNNKNKEIYEKIDKLSELRPEEEYREKLKEEDPEELERARKKLMLMINIKCKGAGPDVINGQIKPMVQEMNIADCENMIKMIKKHGMYGLPMMLKKRTKYLG